MGAIEVGKIPGLTTTDGKPLNLSVGGIGTVMNDTWSAKAPVLAARGIETIAVTPLMRHINIEPLTRLGTIEVTVEEKIWPIQVFEYKMPKGGRVIFWRTNASPNALMRFRFRTRTSTKCGIFLQVMRAT